MAFDLRKAARKHRVLIGTVLALLTVIAGYTATQTDDAIVAGANAVLTPLLEDPAVP